MSACCLAPCRSFRHRWMSGPTTIPVVPARMTVMARVRMPALVLVRAQMIVVVRTRMTVPVRVRAMTARATPAGPAATRWLTPMRRPDRGRRGSETTMLRRT